jgi:peptide-methionine (S)-S-oxide reductase
VEPFVTREQHETITLGAGCFWCLDAVARRIPGIVSSTVGYAGGEPPAPSYEELHFLGSRGYVEAVQIVFDPAVITLESVLDLFFSSHDPTTPNQDGANLGTAYHSTIFHHSEAQLQMAEKVIAELSARLGRPVVTTLREYTTFFPAEPEHQDFYNQNPTNGYCRVVIRPKLKKLNIATD